MKPPKGEPCLNLFINDASAYLRRTGETTLAFGARVKLWIAAWDEDPPGTLPTDDRSLARLSEVTSRQWKRIKHELLPTWDRTDDGRILIRRVALQHARVMEIRAKRQAAGRAGAAAKWEGHRRNIDGKCHADDDGKCQENGWQTHRFANGKQDGKTDGKSDSKTHGKTMASSSSSSASARKAEEGPTAAPAETVLMTRNAEPEGRFPREVQDRITEGIQKVIRTYPAAGHELLQAFRLMTTEADDETIGVVELVIDRLLNPPRGERIREPSGYAMRVWNVERKNARERAHQQEHERIREEERRGGPVRIGTLLAEAARRGAQESEGKENQ